jgi:cold shock CspA family protein
MEGTMLWFNDVKNLGVIETDEGKLPVHGDDFLPGQAPVGRCKGLAVSFIVADDQPERRAVQVSVVPEVVGNRARPRHRGMG